MSEENAVYSSEDGILFNKAKSSLIACPGGKSGDYFVPESVTDIGSRAFEDCPSLTSVVIPEGVTSINSGTFRDCTSLTSITIPESVTSIGGGAFTGCTSLTAIEVGAGNTAYYSEDGVLFNKTKSILIAYLEGKVGAYSIPGSVTSIGDAAFRSCARLTSITIPEGVTSIGQRAFEDCAGLTNITFLGDAPILGADIFSFVDAAATVYVKPGAEGFGATFGGLPVTELTEPPALLVQFSSIAVVDMNMVMGFTSEDGRVYQLEYTGEISGSPHWVPSGSSVTGDGNIAEASVPTGTDVSRIYRVVIGQ